MATRENGESQSLSYWAGDNSKYTGVAKEKGDARAVSGEELADKGSTGASFV